MLVFSPCHGDALLWDHCGPRGAEGYSTEAEVESEQVLLGLIEIGRQELLFPVVCVVFWSAGGRTVALENLSEVSCSGAQLYSNNLEMAREWQKENWHLCLGYVLCFVGSCLIHGYLHVSRDARFIGTMGNELNELKTCLFASLYFKQKINWCVKLLRDSQGYFCGPE